MTRIDRTAARILEFALAGEALPGGSLRATTVPGTASRPIYVTEPHMVLIVALRHGARQWPPASS
jgi:plasmid stabilization system protein ParE